MSHHRSATERLHILQAFHQSGQSVRQFAAERGLARATLERWRKAARSPGSLAPPADVPDPPEFVRLDRRSPEPTMTNAGVSVSVGGARVELVRGFDAELLREVVAALSGGRA